MNERSITDVLTNQTVFSSTELLKELPELIDLHHPPPYSLLPTFLHEATHHWCFTSTVGTTIAILGLRGRINALRAIEAETPQEAKRWEEQATDDLVRAEVASLLLQPLAEGMATFAEFDLSVSLRSPVLPPPLRWTMMFSARDKLTGSPTTRVRRRMDMAESTTAALISARGSERVCRAKEALLAEPLSCEGGSGYLAGYLLIKALWRYLQSHHDRFYQPDVFLLKVYDIFYQDYGFARLLLDQSQSIPAALNPLAPYLVERFKYAFGDSKDSLHGFYESLVSTRSRLYDDRNAHGKVLPLADPADIDPSVYFHAMWNVVIGIPITNLPSNSADWSRWQTAAVGMHMVGYGRNLLELGSLPVQLRVAETETVVQVKEQAMAHLPTISGAPIGQTSGTIHILLNTRSGEQAVVAVSEKLQLIALQKTSEAAKVDDRPLKRSVIGRVQGVGASNAIILEVEEGLNQLRELTRLNGYLQQTRERLNELYIPFATGYVPDSKIYELLPKMMTDGVYGAFDYDADLVRGLAIIGSMAHLHWNPEYLKSQFEKQGLDYEPLMEKLREYSRSTNLFRLREEFGVQSSL